MGIPPPPPPPPLLLRTTQEAPATMEAESDPVREMATGTGSVTEMEPGNDPTTNDELGTTIPTHTYTCDSDTEEASTETGNQEDPFVL